MFNLHLCVTEQAILLDLETKTNLQTCDIVITMKMIMVITIKRSGLLTIFEWIVSLKDIPVLRSMAKSPIS